MENIKKPKIGDEILVFEKYRNLKELDSKNYIKGVITECLVSKELSNHGYEIDIDLYKVIGENGKTYFGTYKNSTAVVEYVYLLTMEDYISYLTKIKNENIVKIKSILDYNKRIDIFIEEHDVTEYKRKNK